MSQGPVVAERLDSWKQIASYMGRTVRTVIRWEQEGGLPVHRVPVGRRQAVYAYPDELDEWLQSSNAINVDTVDAKDAVSDESDSGQSERQAHLYVEVANSSPRGFANGGRAPVGLGGQTKWIVPFGIAAVLVTAATIAVFWLASQRKFLSAGETQITDNGSTKTGLVTDGVNLYFGEWHEGRIVIATVPVQGGEVHEVPTPFVKAEPVAISKDGRRLLVLAGEGMEKERALWIVPTQGGSPQRVGNFLCHSASLSHDGREIAFAFGNALYITADNGASEHLIQEFSGLPEHLRWSLDGKRIVFLLQNETTLETVPWEVVLSEPDHLGASALVPLSLAHARYDTISPVLDNEDDAFVGAGDRGSTIDVLERSRRPWRSGFSLTRFTNGLGWIDDFALDTSSQRLYFLRGAPGQSELDWFDRRSRQFHPFLPGISARDVDFSRDGRRIAFVRKPENTLWVANADGNLAFEVSTPGIRNVELPRWSPDGKQIAFMGQHSDAPYRVFIASATGANLHEASRGTDNQGAPTWSPDRRYLVYGRVECQEEGTCAVGEIDLKTGQQSIVQGSEGLSTARWSPDGRYIAALRADKYQVFLLDRRTGEWRKLADGVNGNDLAWAPDSRAVYASKPGGDRPEVIRISLSDGKVQPAVDLTSFSKLLGRVDTWFAVTPDDSILFLHIASDSEVYSLHYVVR